MTGESTASSKCTNSDPVLLSYNHSSLLYCTTLCLTRLGFPWREPSRVGTHGHIRHVQSVGSLWRQAPTDTFDMLCSVYGGIMKTLDMLRFGYGALKTCTHWHIRHVQSMGALWVWYWDSHACFVYYTAYKNHLLLTGKCINSLVNGSKIALNICYAMNK